MTDFDNLVARVAAIVGGTVLPRKFGGDSPDHFDYAWPRAEMIVKDVKWVIHNQYPYDKVTFTVIVDKMPQYFNLVQPSFSSAVTTSAVRMAQNLTKILADAQNYLAALDARLAVEAGYRDGRETSKTLAATFGIRFYQDGTRGSGEVSGHYVTIDLRETGGVSRLQVDGLTDEKFAKLMEVLKNL